MLLYAQWGHDACLCIRKLRINHPIPLFGVAGIMHSIYRALISNLDHFMCAQGYVRLAISGYVRNAISRYVRLTCLFRASLQGMCGNIPGIMCGEVYAEVCAPSELEMSGIRNERN